MKKKMISRFHGFPTKPFLYSTNNMLFFQLLIIPFLNVFWVCIDAITNLLKIAMLVFGFDRAFGQLVEILTFLREIYCAVEHQCNINFHFINEVKLTNAIYSFINLSIIILQLQFFLLVLILI